MRLCTFRAGGDTRAAGVIVEGDDHDVHVFDAATLLAEPPLGDVHALITRQLIDGLRGEVEALSRLGAAELDGHNAHRGRASDVQLLAPITRPPNIIAVAANYRSHIEEAGRPIPVVPVVFCKLSSSVVGPGEPIVVPSVTRRADYEAELAVVIGREAKQVSAESALDFVAGYTCLNDVSARDWQFKHTTQYTLSKSFDTFTPMGPWLVTTDEIPDPSHLHVSCLVNGEQRQSAAVKELVFPVERLIEYLTQVVTLLPGDVIATGTPGGVGGTMDPPTYLDDGDVVEVIVDQIGSLTNPVRADRNEQS